MNKVLLAVSMLFLSVAAFSQPEKNPFPRTITVSGSAEMEVIPDEIYVLVDLKEYEKKGQGKVSLDKIKSDFLTKAKLTGIPDSAITIAAYDGLNGNPWLRRKKKDELMASISYQVKLKTSRQMDDLVNVLDDNATSNFAIIRTAHSRMAEYRRQLKIQAVRAAKEKASYLSAAIDEKLGEAVTINEPVEYPIQPFYNARASNTALMERDGMDEAQTSVDFRKIKLKYDVSVVFALE